MGFLTRTGAEMGHRPDKKMQKKILFTVEINSKTPQVAGPLCQAVPRQARGPAGGPGRPIPGVRGGGAAGKGERERNRAGHFQHF